MIFDCPYCKEVQSLLVEHTMIKRGIPAGIEADGKLAAFESEPSRRERTIYLCGQDPSHTFHDFTIRRHNPRRTDA